MNRELEGRERLLDTLLEERFAGGDEAARIAARVRAAGAEERARAAAAAEVAAGPERWHGARWLAAAVVLLGAAILAFVLIQRDAQPPRFAQDPELSEQLVKPATPEEFARLLHSATEVHLEHRDVIGARQVATDTGSSDELVTRRNGPLLLIRGKGIAEWQQHLIASLAQRGKTSIENRMLRLTFTLPDQRMLMLTLSDSATEQSIFHDVVGSEPFAATPELLALARQADTDLVRGDLEARGFAGDLAELNALPEDRETIDVPLLGAGLPEALARFGALRQLTLRAGPGALDEALLTALQKLPLRRLVLIDATAPDTAARRAFAKFPKLEELHLLGCPFDAAELRDLLPSFASLRSLVVHGPQLEAVWLEALPRTRIAVLTVLGGKVHADDLAKLAAAPALRDLGFVLPELGDDDVDTLAKLKNLTQLRVLESAMTKDGLDQLRRLMPACQISGDVGMRWFDPRDAAMPR